MKFVIQAKLIADIILCNNTLLFKEVLKEPERKWKVAEENTQQQESPLTFVNGRGGKKGLNCTKI